MEQTTQFTQQKINDLFDANYFGDDAYAQDIQKLWIRRMHELGFVPGESYDSNRFDEGCQSANAMAIRDWENTKILRNAWSGELLEPARNDRQLAERYISDDMERASIENGLVKIKRHQFPVSTEQFETDKQAIKTIIERMYSSDKYIVETFKSLRDAITESAGEWDAEYIAEREAELKELCR